MGTFWVNFILNVAVGILRGALKNPATISTAEHYIVEIRDTTCELALQFDPMVPPPPGYKPA